MADIVLFGVIVSSCSSFSHHYFFNTFTTNSGCSLCPAAQGVGKCAWDSVDMPDASGQGPVLPSRMLVLLSTAVVFFVTLFWLGCLELKPACRRQFQDTTSNKTINFRIHFIIISFFTTNYECQNAKICINHIKPQPNSQLTLTAHKYRRKKRKKSCVYTGSSSSSSSVVVE